MDYEQYDTFVRQVYESFDLKLTQSEEDILRELDSVDWQIVRDSAKNSVIDMLERTVMGGAEDSNIQSWKRKYGIVYPKEWYPGLGSGAEMKGDCPPIVPELGNYHFYIKINNIHLKLGHQGSLRTPARDSPNPRQILAKNF